MAISDSTQPLRRCPKCRRVVEPIILPPLPWERANHAKCPECGKVASVWAWRSCVNDPPKEP